MPFDRNRHDKHTRLHQEDRYHLRQGIARVALKTKVTGKKATDCVGRELQYSNEMAERHGVKKLQAWANGAKSAGGFEGMDFCLGCHRVPEYCQCEQ